MTANSGLYKGDIYENRTLDVSQYKKMYILQALMSQEDKQKMNEKINNVLLPNYKETKYDIISTQLRFLMAQ